MSDRRVFTEEPGKDFDANVLYDQEPSTSATPHIGERQGGVTNEQAMKIKTQHEAEVSARAAIMKDLRRAESDMWRFQCVDQALRDAVRELEVRLYTYEEDKRHQDFRGPARERDYQYILVHLSQHIADLKDSRVRNAEAGEATAKAVAEAKEKLEELLPY